MDEEKHSCNVCDQEAIQRCSGCQAVFYCSREHQRSDWKTHKLRCRAYKVERHPTVGRRLVACRDLRPGDVIIQEAPLVVGPKQATASVCMGCYGELEGKGVGCPLCGWPMCGREQCWADGSDHSTYECALLASTGRRMVGNLPAHGINQSIMVLRCLAMRIKEPAKWDEIVQLESHEQQRRNNGLDDVDRATVVKFIRQTLGMVDFEEELILRLCGILQVNSFELPALTQRQSQQGLQAVYSVASMIEHDCVANATKTFTHGGQVIVRAAVSIPKGDKIALCYTEPMWGTVNRQRHLDQSKFFKCHCDRCKDSTELSTMASGVYCPQCKGGILLSTDPLDEAADWSCASCQTRQTAAYIAALVESIGKDLVSLKRGSLPECETFIRRYSKVLHPHHFYLTDVKMALCQMYGHMEGQNLTELNDDELSKKESLALELLKVADIITPGMNRLRAILLYELQAVVSVRVRKLCILRDISKDELLTNVKMVKKMLKEASTIFSWEHEETDEGQLAKISTKELKDVELFLKTLE